MLLLLTENDMKLFDEESREKSKVSNYYGQT